MIVHADVWADGPVVSWHRSGHSAADVARGLPSHTVGIGASNVHELGNAARVSLTLAEARAVSVALIAALAEIDTALGTDGRAVWAEHSAEAAPAERLDGWSARRPRLGPPR